MSTTTIRRKSGSQHDSFRNFMWISMLMSLAVVFFGMQLMMVGPLKGRLDGIHTRLELSEKNLDQLVGAGDHIGGTNSLLSDLENQARRMEGLEAAVARIASLRESVESEGASASVALQSLDRIASVQKRVVASRQETEAAFSQIERLETLRDEIISGGQRVHVAENTLDGILALQKRVIAASNNYEAASNSITNLAELSDRLVAGDRNLQMASAKFDEFISLQNRMIAAGHNMEMAVKTLEDAQVASGQLIALKDQIISGGADVEAAQSAARTLVAMKSSLTGENLSLNAAGRNLNEMIRLQDQLGQQTSRVAAAIQNLELMDDFQMEVATHIRSLDGLKRTLMDLAMMETVIGRVAGIMSPLAELGNLRRLSDNEIRSAAQLILDERSTRLSRIPDASDNKPVSISDDLEDMVPLPPEARNL